MTVFLGARLAMTGAGRFAEVGMVVTVSEGRDDRTPHRKYYLRTCLDRQAVLPAVAGPVDRGVGRSRYAEQLPSIFPRTLFMLYEH